MGTRAQIFEVSQVNEIRSTNLEYTHDDIKFLKYCIVSCFLGVMRYVLYIEKQLTGILIYSNYLMQPMNFNTLILLIFAELATPMTFVLP